MMIFVAIVLIAGACQMKKEMLTLNNPTITIKDVNVINSDNGKLICYTINLYSPSSLSEFVVIPEVAGNSQDLAEETFTFSNHARRATVTYYLKVSDENTPEEISISFRLNNDTTEVSSVPIVCSL